MMAQGGLHLGPTDSRSRPRAFGDDGSLRRRSWGAPEGVGEGREGEQSRQPGTHSWAPDGRASQRGTLRRSFGKPWEARLSHFVPRVGKLEFFYLSPSPGPCWLQATLGHIQAHQTALFPPAGGEAALRECTLSAVRAGRAWGHAVGPSRAAAAGICSLIPRGSTDPETNCQTSE